MKKPPPIVRVEWEDSALHEGWRSHGERARPVRAHTVGFVVERTRRHITVAANWHQYQVSASVTIPMSAVRSIRKVK